MWIKDGKVSPGWIILDVAHHSDDPEEDESPRLMRVINPTEEQYRLAGYTPYEPPAPEPDPDYERRYQEYLTACAQFRTVCGLIKTFAGLDEFTGGFDEAMEFVQGEAFMANMVQGNYLFSLWQGADKAATYAASKIGIGQPEWWYDCWRQVESVPEEITPEDPVTEEPEANGEEDPAD